MLLLNIDNRLKYGEFEMDNMTAKMSAFARAYLWWIIHPEKKIYAAIGNSGNVVYVNPEEDNVVAVSSCFKPTVFDRVDFIEDVLLPCFR